MFGPMMGAGRAYQRADEEVNRKHNERLQKLHAIMGVLGHVAGVVSVQDDDFDSNAFNVFVHLEGTSLKLKERLQDTKRRIQKAIKSQNARFNFLDWPSKKYEYMNGEKYDKGYDRTYIKLEVYV